MMMQRLQNSDGQRQDTHSGSAGLDYVGVSPILSHLHESKRVRFEAANDADVVEAMQRTVKNEGLIPALESSHAFAQAYQEASSLTSDDDILINMSGRADKDIFTVADAVHDPKWRDFIISKADEYREEMNNG